MKKFYTSKRNLSEVIDGKLSLEFSDMDNASLWDYLGKKVYVRLKRNKRKIVKSAVLECELGNRDYNGYPDVYVKEYYLHFR